MARLSEIVPDISERMMTIARRSAVELASRTYERTPVDTGLLESSWTPDVNKFNYTNSGGSFPQVASRMQLGDSFTLMNTQPYVRVIEYTGHSPQAPFGMMRISVAEWGSIVRSEAAGVS